MLVIIASSLGFAVLVTAKYHTNPQCFYVFYLTHVNEPVIDWSLNMLAFFVVSTPLMPAMLLALTAWTVLTFSAKVFLKSNFENALLNMTTSASPAALLLVPAFFWSDVPGTDWIVHQSFHDGRGSWPFHLFRPANVGLATITCTAVGLFLSRIRKLMDRT